MTTEPSASEARTAADYGERWARLLHRAFRIPNILRPEAVNTAVAYVVTRELGADTGNDAVVGLVAKVVRKVLELGEEGKLDVLVVTALVTGDVAGNVVHNLAVKIVNAVDNVDAEQPAEYLIKRLVSFVIENPEDSEQ